MRNIPFSIIIPWKFGSVQRYKSLRHMVDCLIKQDTETKAMPIRYEILLVEQNTNSITPELCLPYRHILLNTEHEAFNKSWCMNVGARNAKYNDLLFMDADSLFGSDFLKTVRHYVNITSTSRNNIMFCWNYLIALYGKDNPVSRHIRPDMTRAMGGIWYCDKNFYFNKLGGMNENYFGYGGEDNDVFERALFLLEHTPSVIPYPLAHQYHDWEKQADRAINYFEITRANPDKVIQRLITAGIGKIEDVTLIDMEDLLI